MSNWRFYANYKATPDRRRTSSKTARQLRDDLRTEQTSARLVMHPLNLLAGGFDMRCVRLRVCQ